MDAGLLFYNKLIYINKPNYIYSRAYFACAQYGAAPRFGRWPIRAAIIRERLRLCVVYSLISEQ